MRTNSKLFAGITMFASLLFGANAQGLIVENLYESQLYTKSRNVEDREATLKEGLEQVLTRVSGQSDIINHPNIQAALQNPNKFVQQYQYHGDKLEATFSPGLIQKLLSEANMPIWSNNRPVLALWLAMDSGKQRRLVGQETDPSLVALIDKTAQVKGLPVVVPLMDLEDMSKVTVTDVLGQFPSGLHQASSRYGHDGILVGRFVSANGEESGNWSSEWTLLIDGQEKTWQSQGVGLNAAIQQGIDGAMNHLSQLYAVSSSLGDGEAILVSVEDVFSIRDYAEVLNYLRSLAPVEDVLVHQVEADKTVFKLKVKNGGNLNSLTKAMDLDDNLVTLASNHKKGDIQAAYRWTPQGS